MRTDRVDLPYPRRRVLRAFLRFLAGVAFRLVARVEVRGIENIPPTGPAILAANHFHFADPVALLWISKRQVEFVGGFRFPNAPTIVKFLPAMWGYFPVRRGAYSRSSLDYSVATLAKGGLIGIFPEGGAWAQVLRYPRSGIGFIAAESGAPVVPVALSGFPGLFHSLRPVLTITVGEPIGPFPVQVDDDIAKVKRKQSLEGIGDKVMRAIAELLPVDQRGVYSDDAKIRVEAEAVAAYPFDQKHMRGM